MNDKERRLLEMLDRVNAFGSAHAKDFPAGTIGHEMFAMAGRCARQAVGRTTEHMSERRRGTAGAKARARKALWVVLGAIRHTPVTDQASCVDPLRRRSGSTLFRTG